MPPTIRDAKTAALGAMLDIREVMELFRKEWTAPDVRRVNAALVRSMVTQWDAHAQEIEAMRTQNPDLYEKANRQINELRKKMNTRIGG